MRYDEICRAIDNVKKAIDGWVTEYQMQMSPSLHFTGGEPLLRKDLFLIMNYARERGFSISLMSNGTLIDNYAALRIREARVKDVQISLDGLEAVHDDLRGEGSFQRTLKGIGNLVAHGVETNINLTVSRLNMKDTDELVHVAEELGVSAIAFSRLVPTGRGKELSSAALSREEVADFYKGLRRHRDKSSVVVTSRDPLATITDLEDDIPGSETPIGGCAAGIFGVTIASDGTVMPCRRMDLSIGNIREMSFRELWAGSPVLWSLRRREDYHGGCGSCRYWAVCRGCRAIVLAFARTEGKEDYLAPDPQCPYFQS